jgi:hypothetical protein
LSISDSVSSAQGSKAPGFDSMAGVEITKKLASDSIVYVRNSNGFCPPCRPLWPTSTQSERTTVDMISFRRLNIILSGLYWLFSLLLAVSAGRITTDFDWPSFWAVMSCSGGAYAFSAGIWWAWVRFRRSETDER